MLDQETIRREFANFLASDPRIDNALAHVVKIAYQKGIDDSACKSKCKKAGISLKQ